MFARLKQWHGLKNFQISPSHQEDPLEHVLRMERYLDIVIALENLRFLGSQLRLGTIPERAPRGSKLCIFSNSDLDPPIRLPERLLKDSTKWPDHVRSFFDALSSMGPRLERQLHQKEGSGRCKALCTQNVMQRAINHVNSGNVRQICVGKDPQAPDVWLVKFFCAASMRNETYQLFVRLASSGEILNYIDSCTNGCVSLFKLSHSNFF